MAINLSHTYQNKAAVQGYSQRLANMGDTALFIAPVGTNADWFDLSKWYLTGIITGEATINGNIENYEVMTGSLSTRKATIKTAHKDTMAFSVSHVSLAGAQLAYANDTLPTIANGGVVVAADGQTTVATSPDAFHTTVASGSNIVAGDLCFVQNSVNGAGYFDEWVWVEGVSGNTITHNGLSQPLVASTPFLKVKGQGSSVASGIRFTSGGAIFPELEWLVIRYLHPSKCMLVQHRKRGQVVNSTGLTFSVNAPMTVNTTINFIDQGSTSDGALYGYDYWVPLES